VIPGASGIGSTAFGLIAAAAWGGGDFTGGLAARRASPFVTIAMAHGLSLVALVIVALLLHSPVPSAHALQLSVLAGVIAGLSVALFYEALSLGKMGLSAAIAGLLSAAIPVAVSFGTEGLPKPTQIAGFLLAGMAIWLIASAPGGGTHPRSLGLATLAGIGFGVYFVLLKLAGESGVVWPLAFARMGSTTLAASVWAFQAVVRDSPSQNRRPRTAPDSDPVEKGASLWAPAFMALVVGTCVLDTGGNLFYTLATRAGRLDVAAVVSSLYPAGTILLAVWLLQERTTHTQALGMVLALGAVVLIAL
jgi:drug/metabolite transporter (DMT)-like permease